MADDGSDDAAGRSANATEASESDPDEPDATEASESDPGEPEVIVRLPAELRSAFKTPLGAVYTEPSALSAEANEPVIAVGDVVTAHLLRAGHRPTVVVVDGRTQRGETDAWVGEQLPPVADRESVQNPAATLSAQTLRVLRAAVERADGTTLGVEGEEDLIALPAILAVPEGGSVVYGQPGEGMVLVVATPDAKREARRLLERMAGDPQRALDLLGVD